MWQAVDGATLNIPASDGQLVLLKFSRWAGCPICNLHIASIKQRLPELSAAGIRVVMVFHSPGQDVAELRGDLPFALIADPEKSLYRAFGVGSSIFFLAHPKAFRALRSEAKLGNRAQRIHGGIFGLPADLLLDSTGKVIASHYGTHADDNLEVDEVLLEASKLDKRSA